MTAVVVGSGALLGEFFIRADNGTFRLRLSRVSFEEMDCCFRQRPIQERVYCGNLMEAYDHPEYDLERQL